MSPHGRHRYSLKSAKSNASKRATDGAIGPKGIPLRDMPFRTADQPDSIDAADGPHRCAHCGKEFRRACDLNKHAKCHSRPLKCRFPGCKYGTLGWPTANELERHVNDRHAPAPRTHACLFAPCSYRSKRESNCKQHMEKTHGWTYVRSRAARADVPACLQLSPALHGGSSDSLGKNTPIGLGLDLGIGGYSPDSQDSETLIPWTSPVTRLRENTTFLRRFARTYSPPERLAGDYLSVAAATAPPTPVVDTFREAALETPPSATTDPTSRCFSYQPTTQKGGTDATRAPPPLPPGPSRRSHTRAHPSLSSLEPDEGDDDDDDDRPRKRIRPAPTTCNFSDSEMPDIFHAAHPQIYNRANMAKYLSCQSTHKDISTLVRHLGRAPHRLLVEERSISSFGRGDDEYGHVKVGLCRRCWTSFSDPEAFASHLASSCDKISKGKREKWHILFDTFTPLAQNTPFLQSQPPPRSIQPSIQPSLPPSLQPSPIQPSLHSSLPPSLQPSPVQPSPIQSSLHSSLPPSLQPSVHHPHPSPHPPQPSQPSLLHPSLLHPSLLPLSIPEPSGPVPRSPPTSVPTPSLGRQFVPLAEHRRVCDEVQFLKALLVLLVLREHPRAISVSQDPNAQLHISPVDAPDAAATTHPDRESLVGHMDCRPTNVDRQGLMDEVEVLSRSNSGLSSDDRSTIHHIPNSPPPRPQREQQPADAGASIQPPGPAVQPHLPTSLADSGYGSDKRQGTGPTAAAEQIKEAVSPGASHDDVVVPGRPLPTPLQAPSRRANTGSDPLMPAPMWHSESSMSMTRWVPGPLEPQDPESDSYVVGSFCTDGSGNDEFSFPGPLDSQEG